MPDWTKLIVEACGMLITITTVSTLIYKWLTRKLKAWILKEIVEVLEGRITTLEGWTKSQQEDLDTLFNEKLLVFKSLQVILDELYTLCRAIDVEKARNIQLRSNELEDYLLNRSAIQRSRKYGNTGDKKP